MARNQQKLVPLTAAMLSLLLSTSAHAQAMNMQQMPGMQMPPTQSTPQHDMHDMKDMPMDHMQHQHDAATESKDDQQDLPSGPIVRLEELEQMALSRNPTLAQAKANVAAAEGAKKQAGLYPNPTVGYYGDEIRGGSFQSGKQGAFLNQTIVLGGKLGAARKTAEQQRLQAVTNVDSQRYRVLNNVRSVYYQVLAAQRLVQVRRQLSNLANDAVETAHQLGNVGQADRPDVLQAEVEAEQAALSLQTAKQNYQASWQTLASTVGNPDLPLSRVEGNLENVPHLDQQEWLAKMLSESPQVRYAQQDVDRAKAALREEKKVPIPDLQISANVSQDNEPLDTTNGRTGIVGGAQIGMQLPIFNHNQGNVQRAKAELERSQEELQRVQLELRRQVTTLFRDYTVSSMTADRYRTNMLPRAQKAYELYRGNYQNMAAAYPQVLIAQRTLFQLQADYIESLETVWLNALQIESYGLTDGLSAPAELPAASYRGSGNSPGSAQ